MTVADASPRDWDSGVERRHLTILFCDMVGSTPIASAMDPEDLHELLTSYQQYCERCVEGAGGFLAQYAGDGVLALFGYPIALEDAPQRALQAAVRLREAGEHLTGPTGEPLAVRVGVATGQVVVGDLVAQGRAVAGETTNLAARLQASAAPNAIVVADSTKRLAEGLFEFRALAPLNLKGFPTPVTAWEVANPRPIVSRFEGRRRAGISPLVSRASELRRIFDAWRKTRRGRPQVVGIVGDPGFGKSRLVEEVRLRTTEDPSIHWLEGGGASFHDNTPYHVIAQFAPAEAFDDDLAPDDLQARLAHWVWAQARRTPTILVLEDLHWADPSTLDLLDLLIRGDQKHPLLILYTSRADFRGRWPPEGRHQVITLGTLDGAASRTLARSVLGGGLETAEVSEIVARVVQQAGGVPLYIEELSQLRAGQVGASGRREVPATLADLLTARLETLGPLKRHAQIAAVLGHEFSGPLFAAMLAAQGADAKAALSELQRLMIIVPREADGTGGYAFRHALIADAGYSALLRRQRRLFHGQAAQIIEERFPDFAEAQPQGLARHWAEAGNTERAVAAWEKAGNVAYARRAFREAEHAFREALVHLEQAASFPERDASELRIRPVFNRVLQITQGYSSPEAAASSDRVTELAERAGSAEALSREQSAKWRSVFTAGDYAEAERIVARIMALTRSQGNALWRRTFELRAGVQHGFYAGDLARGDRDFLEWASIEDGSHRGAGDDVLTMGIGALIAQMMGRQTVGEERIAGAFAIADRRGNPYDLAMALHTEACFRHHSLDGARQAEAADRLADVAAESGFEYAGALATGWLSLACANAGRAAEALERCQAAIVTFEKLGARVSMVFWLRLLGRCHQLNGDLDEAHRSYSRAIAFNPQEKAFRVEAYRDRAEFWSASGRTDEAARDLDKGIRLAAAMGAVTFELRLTIELARLHLGAGDGLKLQETLGCLGPLACHDHAAFDRENLASLARDTGSDFLAGGQP